MTALQATTAAAARQFIVGDADAAPPIHIVLNDRWRIRLDDPLQWILEYREGALGKKSTGYKGRSYCTQRGTLKRCIREYCGPVGDVPLRQVEALAERNERRSLFEMAGAT